MDHDGARGPGGGSPGRIMTGPGLGAVAEVGVAFDVGGFKEVGVVVLLEVEAGPSPCPSPCPLIGVAKVT